MLKKLKRFTLLSMAFVMMLSCATVSFAKSDVYPIGKPEYKYESYMYHPDDLYVKAGSKVVLKSLLTTDGSFYLKALDTGSITVVLGTDKIPTASFDLEFDVKSTKNETTHTVRKFNNVTYGNTNIPNFYNDSFATITLVAKSDLYIASYYSNKSRW